jgi:general stress protein YciG
MTKAYEKGRRGFASMAPDLQRAIARKGGIVGHQLGRLHEWTHDEAVAAGRKGGKRSAAHRIEK